MAARLELDDLWKSLPAQIILRFCDDINKTTVYKACEVTTDLSLVSIMPAAVTKFIHGHIVQSPEQNGSDHLYTILFEELEITFLFMKCFVYSTKSK